MVRTADIITITIITTVTDIPIIIEHKQNAPRR